MAKGYSKTEREKIIAHVLAELSAGTPISRTLGDDREKWLCTERCWWNWYYEADASDENGLVQKVARARDCGVEAQMDKAACIAMTPMDGTITTVEQGGENGTVTRTRTEDMLGHRKLVVDTLLKQAQMLKPKTYGPKLDLTSAGERLGLVAELEAARRRAAGAKS
jgi:hypothetical protein